MNEKKSTIFDYVDKRLEIPVLMEIREETDVVEILKVFNSLNEGGACVRVKKEGEREFVVFVSEFILKRLYSDEHIVDEHCVERFVEDNIDFVLCGKVFNDPDARLFEFFTIGDMACIRQKDERVFICEPREKKDGKIEITFYKKASIKIVA